MAESVPYVAVSSSIDEIIAEKDIELCETRPRLKSISVYESEAAGSKTTTSTPHKNQESMIGFVRRTDSTTNIETDGAAKAEEKLDFTWGVYLPTVQNILGVILFVRLPWIVAQAGIILTLVIIALCVGSTLLTSLSLSAIATNGKIMAGGPYFVISRNLGGELGGAIGVIFYLGTTLAASMYVLGAIESLQVGFGLANQFYFDVQVEALVLVFAMAFVVHVGVKYVNMSATFFLGVVFLSIFCSILGSFLYLGGVWEGDVGKGANVAGDNFTPNFTKDPDTGLTPTFFSLIGLFYPSVTGIMAGCNRSGVLKNPSKDIPVGTVGAILTTACIYITVVLLMGNILSNEYLLEDKLAFASISWPPVLVNIGIVMSSVGAGMQSLTGAPRLLSAIANDGYIPFLKVFACPGDVNPTNAIWMTYFIASLPCLAGNLDYITPIVTLFFLVMYTAVNFAAFLLAYLDSPGFRPSWPYFSWKTALLGFTWCLTLMFMISYQITLVVLVLVILLYLYISSYKASSEWGDASSGLKFSVIVNTLRSLDFSSIMHAKNWRPQALVMFRVDKSGIPVNKDLLFLASQMKKGRGLLLFVGTLEGDPVSDFSLVDPARENLNSYLHSCGIDSFCRVIMVQDPYMAFITAFQTMGIGALRPNTIIMSWGYYWKSDKSASMRFVHSLKAAMVAQRALIVFKQSQTDSEKEAASAKGLKLDDAAISVPVAAAEGGVGASAGTAASAESGLSNSMRINGYIDIWWLVHDGGLLLLIPHLLTLDKVWKSCKLRVFALVTEEDESAECVKQMTKEFMRNVRIEAEIIVVSLEAVDDHITETAQAMALEMQAVRDDFRPTAANTKNANTKNGTLSRSNSIESPVNEAGLMRRNSLDSQDSGDHSSQHTPRRHSREGSVDSVGSNKKRGLFSPGGHLSPSSVDLDSAAKASQERIKARSRHTGSMSLHGDDAAQMRWAVALNQEIVKQSSQSELVVTNLPLYHNSVPSDFLSFVDVITSNIKRCVLIKGSGEEVVTKYG